VRGRVDSEPEAGDSMPREKRNFLSLIVSNKGINMKKQALVLLVAVALLGTMRCKSPTSPDLDTFIGTWNVTKAELVSEAWPDTKQDVIAQGASATMVISSTTLVITFTFTNATGVPDVVGGTWSASKDVMTVEWTSGWIAKSEFDWSLNGDVLTLTGGPVPHQFDILEDPQNCTLTLIAVRQ
jgi:hypothetical protein